MPADALLARLHGVRRTGRGRWMACCPAHDDRSPSLSVTELDDGRVLMRCFAECPTADVLAAVGLDFNALFPERPLDHRVRRERRPFNAHDVLQLVAREALIAATAASWLAAGRVIDEADRARLITAAIRLREASELCDG